MSVRWIENVSLACSWFAKIMGSRASNSASTKSHQLSVLQSTLCHSFQHLWRAQRRVLGLLECQCPGQVLGSVLLVLSAFPTPTISSQAFQVPQLLEEMVSGYD